MKTAKTKIMRTAFGTLIFALLASTCTAFEIFALTNNDTDDVALSASFGNAVWQGKDPNGGDWEIYLYSKDTDEIQKITDNDANDINPVIAGPYVAWEVWDGNDFEICVYNGDKITQITNNDSNDVEPNISAPFLFWRVWDGNDWEINQTKLPRLPMQIKCKITPTTLNLKSKGNWVDVMLVMPSDIKPSSINTSTILLEGLLSPVKVTVYDTTRIVHMKFSRSQLQAILTSGTKVTLDITAYLNDGTKITTSDTIRVIH